MEDGPDMQLLECAQADTWELSWSTSANTFQVRSTAMPELCLFGYPRADTKSFWRALPCDASREGFDFTATERSWAKPTSCH